MATVTNPTMPYVETITAGTEGDSVLLLGPVKIVIEPGVGGNAKMQYTHNSDVGSADWTDWEEGDVTAQTAVMFEGQMAYVRGSATTADAVFRVIRILK